MTRRGPSAPAVARPVPAGDLPVGEEKVRAVDAMFDAIAPRYDVVNRIMTFGLDVWWRRRAVRALGLPQGSVVLDLACGTGDLCRNLQRSGLVGVGIDRSAGMLRSARTRAALVRGDALALPLPDSVADGVVSGFALRNFAGLEPFFAEAARVLRPGGRISLLEVAVPRSPVLRAGHAVYFGHVAPFIGGLVSDRGAYRYLPRSVAYLPPVPTLLGLIESAGFRHVQRRPLGLGAAQLLTATRP